jgi:hypothetical protein
VAGGRHDLQLRAGNSVGDGSGLVLHVADVDLADQDQRRGADLGEARFGVETRAFEVAAGARPPAASAHRLV